MNTDQTNQQSKPQEVPADLAPEVDPKGGVVPIPGHTILQKVREIAIRPGT